MSTGGDKEKQFRSDQGFNQTEDFDKTPVYVNPDFQGRDGQSDNQSTKRPKGEA